MDERRKSDPRIDSLVERQARIDAKLDHHHECLEKVKQAVAENTEITQQVRDILTSFTVVGRAAKWIGGVAAAAAAVWAMLKGFRS